MSNFKTLGLNCWVYDVVPEKYYHTDLGEYHTYGIKATGSEFSTVLHDVSVRKKVVDSMVEAFNQYQLSPIHLEGVVEDMLA